MSNWKQFLVLGLIYLLIFFAFSNAFSPFNDKLAQGFELMDNTKMNNAIIKVLVIGLVAFTLISTWLLSIHNFFVGALINLLANPELSYRLILKKTLKSFWKIFAFSILQLFVVTFGLIFFLLPGIYLLFIFYFALPIMINENLSIIKSLKKAKTIFNQKMWQKISLILLLKLSLFIVMIIFSIIELSGVVILADWFLSTMLVYSLIYNEDDVIKSSEKLTTENE